MELRGKRIAREGGTVIAGGKEVGVVTSGTFSPTFNKVIAMAYIEQSCQAVGTPVQVDIRGTPEPGEIVPMPFYRRSRE